MIKVHILGTIERIRGEWAVEPLIQALKNENEDVRKTAAITLGKIGDTRAIEPLTQALGDKSKYVRNKAQKALKKIKAT